VFSGVVTILVNALVSTNQIVLNAKELAFQRVEFTDASGKKFFTSQISQDEKEQTVKFEFVENFTTGNGSLRIEYTGVLNNDMVGFYASKYEKNGVKKNMATTQFEAVYARRAIPCWDEPAIKAAFTVHLTVQKDLTAVSNMPVVSTSQVGDKVKYTYDKSPIMSTYLLAFVIGEFEYVEAVTKGGVKIRVYTPVGKTDQGNFGLDIAVKCLDFYDKYFEIPYPLPKLDMLAIPDFAMGAMENWGCVTYRSTALLVDPKMTSASVKQWVALVIAHELAHQWFGNVKFVN
jgi:puromycin-sensitive aminopeptidase